MYSNAGNGLKMIFAGEIVSIIAGLFSNIIGSVLGAVSMIFVLLGLKQASLDDEGYSNALVFTIANIIVGFFTKGDGIIAAFFSIIGSVLSLLILYTVCHVTAKLLRSCGEESIANLGMTTWHLNLIVTIVLSIFSILLLIPVLNIAFAFLSIIPLIAALVGGIMYLVFLNKSGKALS